MVLVRDHDQKIVRKSSTVGQRCLFHDLPQQRISSPQLVQCLLCVGKVDVRTEVTVDRNQLRSFYEVRNILVLIHLSFIYCLRDSQSLIVN